MSSLKARLRPPLAALLYPASRPFRPVLERDRSGARLRRGITAVVAARDERYTIGFCLRSLVEVADQIVCIDNGSTDGTLEEMRRFQESFGNDVEVEVVSLPNALLGDCRQEGLRRSRHEWHLRWDADMVAKTSGPESMTHLRSLVLASARPRTIQLPRTNLSGDLRHTYRLGGVVDPGEPILARFGRQINYREYGRFDAYRTPLHYAQARDLGRYYFHLAGLKSDENLMHRNHYFNWRETVNRYAKEGRAAPSFEEFKHERNLRLLGTDDPRSVKFRSLRQVSCLLARYDPARYGQYPEVLDQELARPDPRFEVLYRDGRPWIRIDREDAEMLSYEPTAADLAWDPEEYLRGVLSPERCRAVGIAPGD